MEYTAQFHSSDFVSPSGMNRGGGANALTPMKNLRMNESQLIHEALTASHRSISTNNVKEMLEAYGCIADVVE